MSRSFENDLSSLLAGFGGGPSLLGTSPTMGFGAVLDAPSSRSGGAKAKPKPQAKPAQQQPQRGGRQAAVAVAAEDSESEDAKAEEQDEDEESGSEDDCTHGWGR
jgi:hypothetical protein